jgi:hypothetical protein
MGRKDEATLAEAFEKVMEGEIEREREKSKDCPENPRCLAKSTNRLVFLGGVYLAI